ENKWSIFFVLTTFVVPLVATFGLMNNVGDVFATIDGKTLSTMVVASFLWGTGVMMWGKAIDHIGVSLGFSLFIGTVILVGSVLPLGIAALNGESLPPTPTLAMILGGILIVLFGVVANGKAGLVREADEVVAEQRGDEDESSESPPSHQNAPAESRRSYTTGVSIAVVGGLLATGFSVANAVGGKPLGDAVVAQGNPPWMTALAVMLPVFLSGGVVMTAYFGIQLSREKAWQNFATPSLPRNMALIFVMAFFHYAASAVFAYASYVLGESGPVVGYAIFNTACLVVAAVSGLVTGEWSDASAAAKKWLFVGMACMVGGVFVLAGAQALTQSDAGKSTGEETVAIASVSSVEAAST
ncbi:MAG: rhamnose/proton symporter RhaT, partial [Planctomycetota bacterium]